MQTNHPDITLAKTAGFCFGVNRAVQMVYRLLAQGERVCTLGPIIHNPQLVNDLAERGVIIVNSPSDAPKDAVLVIRSHGVTRQTMEELERLGIRFEDATCPFVKKIHRIVQQAAEEGHAVWIAGDENHPEVKGIKSYCRDAAFIFQNEQELQNLLKEHTKWKERQISVVAQTTFHANLWKKCVVSIKKVYTNAVIFDTICNATSERQAEAERLAQNTDLMIVVGGRESSNTAKLQDVCRKYCDTCLIESAHELDTEKVRQASSICVTAGASTPAGIIKEVLKTMSEIIDPVAKSEPVAAAADAVNNEPVAAEPPAEVVEEKAQKSFDEMTYEEALEASLNSMNTDQKVKGYVLAISPTEIQVDIGRKHAGYVPIDEFSSDPTVKVADQVKVGDMLDLIVMRTNDQEGTVMLSKKRFDAINSWERICAASESGEVLEGVVVEVIKGGLLVMVDGSRVFVPASQATATRGEPLEDLLKTHVNLRIIEVNRGRKRAVGSIRSTLRDQRREQEAAFWKEVEADKVYTGKVKSLTSYGAFVDLGGVDGMVHISELSWKRIKHPSEVVNVGDVIEVFVKHFDAEKRKVSLGYKKPEDNPWNIFLRDYQVGEVVPVKIVSMTTYGAFANIIDGVDGLIHISQIADTRIEKPQDVLSVGQEVNAKIIAVDEEKKRVSLSIRALAQDVPAVEGEVSEPQASEDTPAE